LIDIAILKGDMGQIVVKIVYDNRKENPAMQEGWGFSCLVSIDHRKILFDTGADKNAFLSNLNELETKLDDITDIVFSHKHSDHTAGLQEILASLKKNVHLYLPKGFPISRIPPVVQMTHVSDFAQIDAHVYSFVLKGGFFFYEQALVLQTKKGLVIITGCAHPGIVEYIEAVKAKLNAPIHLVLGGFHLFRKNHRYLEKVVDQFKSLGVKNAAPCHCSGDAAIAQFETAYKEHFYKIGTGTILTFEGK
jgi:7,8-dihydropterin-6-yl-methyl-4-(beta-D-ribofuranosyl)aminobenzene 5'-phosphate synthase